MKCKVVFPNGDTPNISCKNCQFNGMCESQAIRTKVKKNVVLNTIHYAVEVKETDEGVLIDVFHRNGDLINTHTYWNEDVIEVKNEI